MKKLGLALCCVVGAAALLLASIFAVSESGTEIVTLESFEAEGTPVETRLWVVDYDGDAWLRAGRPDSAWLARMEANPEVFVTRGEERRPFLAAPTREPAARDRIHALMKEKYGWSDRWISAIRDASQSVPVRLQASPSR